MKTIVAIVSILALAGCDAQKAVADQCLRQDLFYKCLAALPAGPVATKYNDWSEVVSECKSAAYYMSVRRVDHIKPECAAF